MPPGPYAERTFVTYFEFNRDFLVYQYDDFIIDNAVTWLRAAKPKKLIITGYAALVKLAEATGRNPGAATPVLVISIILAALIEGIFILSAFAVPF